MMKELVPSWLFGGEVLKALGMDPTTSHVGNIEIVLDMKKPVEVILHRYLVEDEIQRLLEAIAPYHLITKEEFAELVRRRQAPA